MPAVSRSPRASSLLPSPADLQRASRAALPADIAFLAERGLTPRMLALAAQLARQRGTSASQELMALPGFSRALYWRLLAEHLGLPFIAEGDPVTLLPEALPPAAETIARSRRMLVEKGAARVLVLAPEGPARVEELQRLLMQRPEVKGRFAIADPATIQACLLARNDAGLAYCAAHRLARAKPQLSALLCSSRKGRLAIGAAPLTLIALILVSPLPFGRIVAILLSAFFFLSMLLKSAIAFLQTTERPARPLSDADLPSYTILVPLYREAGVVPDLISHLDCIDYPSSKLQCLLLIEADDEETLAAARRHARHPRYQIVAVPPQEPRTKPKALVYGLPFATGRLVVVYDAEDRPEPDQLRKAAAAFAEDRTLGCVQARLTIDNTENVISKLFALEYAANFDVFLPALAHWRMPLPLGGTSNHFPLAVLKRIGAWDPFNVTEDADLGIRLARYHYRSITIASRTFEEAPVSRSQWMGQRRRWVKGWMQSLLVAMWPVQGSAPGLTARDRLAVLAILGMGVAGLLAYAPACLVGFLAALAFRGMPEPDGLLSWSLFAANFLNVTVLVLSSATMAFRGLRSIGRTDLVPMIALLPFYWMAMSLASWQAFFQLLRRPFLWEKTAHGLSKTRGMKPDAQSGAARWLRTSRFRALWRKRAWFGPRRPGPAICGTTGCATSSRPSPAAS
ncbi:glycosyltransferase [Afifella sp. JA880]|uniref:glycosyltransferase n=1 Tax=Afifella sp. JA880 TaxID=2975280 RepID=UPI0021BABBD2|nr:glycosyltransferase [Afifella sp. JA880]MCT8269041.1 glycosyltransferase [Afifella sp. JA880]